jgi:methylisocitrate lyase
MRRDATPGARFRKALDVEIPLQIVGAVNAYAALLAEQAGFRALYLSGAGVANASLGLPDLGVTTPGDVLTDLRRITAASELPVLVDADTGWGSGLVIGRVVAEMERAGAAGLHLEDQEASVKRCGHRPGKVLVPVKAMQDRVRAALDGRRGDDFVVMARTDAYGVEGLDQAIERARAYAEAGADMIFAEAMTGLDEYRRFCGAVPVPVLANLTEFGRTPLFTLHELREAGVRLALYPLSAFRAMSAAASEVYRALRQDGDQRGVLQLMQTREQLYEVLDYDAWEAKLEGRPRNDRR